METELASLWDTGCAWAGRVARQWLLVRLEQGIPGEMLFPSTRSAGKPWGKVAQYNAAKQVLTDAGIDSTEGAAEKRPLRLPDGWQ
jgi:hypothetical protein